MNSTLKTVSSLLFLFLFSFHYSAAQKTSIYTDNESDYKKGVELFEQKKYGAAQKKFQNVIDMYSGKTDRRDNTLLNALYYRAVCAEETNGRVG